jgi:hypothetical protein
MTTQAMPLYECPPHGGRTRSVGGRLVQTRLAYLRQTAFPPVSFADIPPFGGNLALKEKEQK